VISQFASDPLLNPFDIHVRIENGTATLEGLVDTDIQYDRAVNIAKHIQGVEKVDATNLKIKDSKQPYTDAWIHHKD